MTGEATADGDEERAGVRSDAAPPAPDGPYAAWDRIVVWWDVVFVAILILTAIQIAVEGARGADLLLSYVAIAAIGIAYAVWGGRAARSRNQSAAAAYVVVLVIGTGTATASSGSAPLLLFVAFSHAWMLLERRRWAVVVSAALALAASLGILIRVGFAPEAVIVVPAQMGVVLLFAVGLGIWVAWTMRQGEEHARLVDELRAAQDALARSHHAAGVEAERARIAREIHDTLAQGFTSVVMQAQAASAVLDADDGAEAARDRLGLIEETARDNLAEARALVAAFAPAPLKEQSLAEALGRLVARFGDETGLQAWFVADGVLGLPPSAEVVLLRVAQEGLANVRRHAAASAVEVRLTRVDDTVLLEVSDDGRGLPEGFGFVAGEGFGLSGMRERVTTAGGSLSIGPGETGGTVLAVRLPLHDGESQGERG
ncbi:sensor histidine kinase [Myceligenerans pegani]|uniref:Oxygen sensor histidine kinase NreB n=1 Tax=Myceligenerans pegani TaxID=2776917 RepID=A0ABR9MYR5_9MICO|nr:sensor histidine kinase [Myceligenerans sp. TRM 65318]MBE1876250.1 sensor histidine kinase [Myceligenerans sp. TRM 65318]MBE3018521.1 sensor histidine kinase [Myceligenerans sp. TRM 65318]